jgi:hypothetical protein
MARNHSTSSAQRNKQLPNGALASAQVIPIRPYLLRKQEQEAERPRFIHQPPIDERHIRAWVAAMIEWGARY